VLAAIARGAGRDFTGLTLAILAAPSAADKAIT
jgi:hypothetical protein